MKTCNRRDLLVGIGAGLTLPYSVGQAQVNTSWPKGVVRVVVPAGGGSGTDIFARFFCDKFAAKFGQPFVVDNKPGASGMIGTDAVAKAKPDGQTLLFSNSGFTVMSAGLNMKTPYELQRDLIPIVQIAAGGVFLIVKPSFPANTLSELVAVVKANPEKYNYGTWGIGTSAHLVMEGIKFKTGMKINHVAFKTTSQVQQAIMSGELEIGWCDLTSGFPLVKQGLIKAIAVSGSKRAPNNPDIPTVAEQGYGLDNDGWYGMFATTGTPAEIIDAINGEVNMIMRTPEWEQKLLSFNAPSNSFNSPADFKKTISRDIATWSDIVQKNDIKIN